MFGIIGNFAHKQLRKNCRAIDRLFLSSSIIIKAANMKLSESEGLLSNHSCSDYLDETVAGQLRDYLRTEGNTTEIF